MTWRNRLRTNSVRQKYHCAYSLPAWIPFQGTAKPVRAESRFMFRPWMVVVFFFLNCICFAQDAGVARFHVDALSRVGLVDGPQSHRPQDQVFNLPSTSLARYSPDEHDVVALGGQKTVHSPVVEPFHWKGLLLQSLSFDMLQNATRIMTADQRDRHILLNKPFWSDYWASLNQFNMRRWNDGDSIKVNYIGHPMQGAISGYIEVQNDPRGRLQEISKDPEYWRSRFRAFLWQTVYSTQWEIGPLGETAIFNQGGFTYPIRCNKHPGTPDYCENPGTTYTNNTGWVDFIITPVVGSLWLIGEDAIDRYISDPLVRHHPNNFGIKSSSFVSQSATFSRQHASRALSLVSRLRASHRVSIASSNPFPAHALRAACGTLRPEPALLISQRGDQPHHMHELSPGCDRCRSGVRPAPEALSRLCQRCLHLSAGESGLRAQCRGDTDDSNVRSPFRLLIQVVCRQSGAFSRLCKLLQNRNGPFVAEAKL